MWSNKLLFCLLVLSCGYNKMTSSRPGPGVKWYVFDIFHGWDQIIFCSHQFTRIYFYCYQPCCHVLRRKQRDAFSINSHNLLCKCVLLIYRFTGLHKSQNQLRWCRNLFANYDKLNFFFFTPVFLCFRHCFLTWLLQMQTRRVQAFKPASEFCRAILFLLFFPNKVGFPSVGMHLTNHSACRYQITIKRFKRDCFYSLHNVFVKKMMSKDSLSLLPRDGRR